MNVLYKSVDVKKEIIRLFSNGKGRRIAISAFVGDEARAYLPKPKGLRLICWPRAGGTNPNELRKLIKQGVSVEFADSLHMKIYWAKGLGAVVTSANLSTNALGSGGLKEIGLRFGADQVDIDQVIRSIKPHPVKPSELNRLDREHRAYLARNPAYLTRKRRAISFKEWYESQPAMREPWKLDGIKEYSGEISKKAKEVSLGEYGRPPVNVFRVRARDYSDYSKWDWILTFNLKTADDLAWFCISNMVKVPSKDKGYEREYPCEMIQNAPLRVYEVPPFTLDRPFRTAFKKAANTYGLDRLEEHTKKPPVKLLELLHGYY